MPQNPQNLGVFYCDLSPSQRQTAEASSARNGALARGAIAFQLCLTGTKPNLEWSLESRSLDNGQGGQPIDALAEDLLAFAAHLYQADRILRRPEKPPRDWSREIELHVGVHDEDLWNSKATDLAKLLGDITHDTFRVAFHHRQYARPALRLPPTAPPVEGGICVFSTHFKSVFGIACQSEQGDLIASVRYGSGSPQSSQDELIAEISRATNPFPFIAFRLRPINLPSEERTQRTLGFLQFALATVLARRLELESIQLFDDAISTYHLRQRQICGPGFAVRDTRPDFLWQTLDVFKQLGIIKDLKIRNPFQFSTAAEVLTCLSGRNHKARRSLLLHKTDNCLEKDLAKALAKALGVSWNGAAPHCGCCFPCKLRRLAALAAGLETRNAHDAYAIDPLDTQIPSAVLQQLSDNHRRRVEDYHIKGLPVFKSYLENFQPGSSTIGNSWIRRAIQGVSSEKFFLDASPPGVPKTQVTATDIFLWIVEVHTRFHGQVLRFF